MRVTVPAEVLSTPTAQSQSVATSFLRRLSLACHFGYQGGRNRRFFSYIYWNCIDYIYIYQLISIFTSWGLGEDSPRGTKSLFPLPSERKGLLIVEVCHHTFSFSQTFSHLHIFSSWHLRILMHLLFIFFHRLIFTSSHLHIFSSSHLLIFTSSHVHNLSSSHLHIFFTSSHLDISSHLHIFFTSSHLHILPFRPLALLPSSLSFLSISLLRRGAVPTRRHEMQPFRTKWGWIVKKCAKLAILKRPAQPCRTKWSSIVKTCRKIEASATLSHKMRFDRQKM